MKLVYVDELEAEIAFAETAAKWFAENPKGNTYTDGEIEPGCLFAVRWGLGDDCVLVIRLDDNHIPTNYQELVKKYYPEEEAHVEP